MSTQSVPHATDARKLFEDPLAVVEYPEILTQKLQLIHLALLGLSVLRGKDLDADLFPIQETVGDALRLAEAISEAGIRLPSAPDAPPSA